MRLPIGAGDALRDPFLYVCEKFLLGHRNRVATFAGIPSPKYEGRAHVFHHLIDGAAAVLLGILKQFAELVVRKTFPDHRHVWGREMPVGSARRDVQTRKVVILMTRAALHAGDAFPIRSAPDVHGVWMIVIALARGISLRVAVDAARVPQDRDNRFESARSGRFVA